MILDDSSGATIEVTCGRSTEQSTFAQHDAQRTTTAQTKAVMGDTATGYKVELTGVDVGSAVKIKGSIGTFRESRQIQLERLCKPFEMPDTCASWPTNYTLYADSYLQGSFAPQMKKQQHGPRLPLFAEMS